MYIKEFEIFRYLFNFFGASKFLPIYLCITTFNIKLQNGYKLMETPITQTKDLCRRYGDTPSFDNLL